MGNPKASKASLQKPSHNLDLPTILFFLQSRDYLTFWLFFSVVMAMSATPGGCGEADSSVKWQLCYDVTAKTWWMVSVTFDFLWEEIFIWFRNVDCILCKVLISTSLVIFIILIRFMILYFWSSLNTVIQSYSKSFKGSLLWRINCVSLITTKSLASVPMWCHCHSDVFTFT